jgi:hypothetical protein
MDMILHFDRLWLVVLFLVIPLAAAAILQFVTQHTALRPHLVGYGGVVGPFFVSVGLLFGLFATFLAADIWERVKDCNHSIEIEIGAIQTIKQVSLAVGQPAQDVERALQDYLTVTMHEEWDTSQGSRSEAAELALGRMVGAILEPGFAQVIGTAAQDTLLSSFKDIREARVTRSHIASTHSDPYKWATVILLGILTQVALVFCHVGDRKAQAAALLLFSLGFSITLVALGLHEQPLSDPDLVALSRLHRIGE